MINLDGKLIDTNIAKKIQSRALFTIYFHKNFKNGFFEQKWYIYSFFFFLQNRVLSFRATYCWISFLLSVTNKAKKIFFFFIFRMGIFLFWISICTVYQVIVQKKVYPLLNYLSLITHNSELIHDTNLTLLKTQ